MGRYYSGDIEGKFWFGLQSSDSADRFGVTGEQPQVIQYNFTEENLNDVEEEIKNIEEKLSDKLAVIEKFFGDNNSYTDNQLKDAGISTYELGEYADLMLGRQIRDYLKENGECYFEAEC